MKYEDKLKWLTRTVKKLKGRLRQEEVFGLLELGAAIGREDLTWDEDTIEAAIQDGLK